jgi:hypothetical protein
MLSHAEDISFLKVLCICTARVAVTNGRRGGGGKLKLGSAELKLERQGRETASLLVSDLSLRIAHQQPHATCCLETMRTYRRPLAVV